jgi:hypothetical protein
MDSDIDDHAGLINALGGAAKVAAAAETLPVNARAWSARNRIPPEYWPGLIALAAEQGVVVSADWLMRTTPARANRATSAAEAIAA